MGCRGPSLSVKSPKIDVKFKLCVNRLIKLRLKARASAIEIFFGLPCQLVSTDKMCPGRIFTSRNSVLKSSLSQFLHVDF